MRARARARARERSATASSVARATSGSHGGSADARRALASFASYVVRNARWPTLRNRRVARARRSNQQNIQAAKELDAYKARWRRLRRASLSDDRRAAQTASRTAFDELLRLKQTLTSELEARCAHEAGALGVAAPLAKKSRGTRTGSDRRAPVGRWRRRCR